MPTAKAESVGSDRRQRPPTAAVSAAALKARLRLIQAAVRTRNKSDNVEKATSAAAVAKARTKVGEAVEGGSKSDAKAVSNGEINAKNQNNVEIASKNQNSEVLSAKNQNNGEALSVVLSEQNRVQTPRQASKASLSPTSSASSAAASPATRNASTSPVDPAASHSSQTAASPPSQSSMPHQQLHHQHHLQHHHQNHQYQPLQNHQVHHPHHQHHIQHHQPITPPPRNITATCPTCSVKTSADSAQTSTDVNSSLERSRCKSSSCLGNGCVLAKYSNSDNGVMTSDSGVIRSDNEVERGKEVCACCQLRARLRRAQSLLPAEGACRHQLMAKYRNVDNHFGYRLKPLKKEGSRVPNPGNHGYQCAKSAAHFVAGSVRKLRPRKRPSKSPLNLAVNKSQRAQCGKLCNRVAANGFCGKTKEMSRSNGILNSNKLRNSNRMLHSNGMLGSNGIHGNACRHSKKCSHQMSPLSNDLSSRALPSDHFQYDTAIARLDKKPKKSKNGDIFATVIEPAEFAVDRWQAIADYEKARRRQRSRQRACYMGVVAMGIVVFLCVSYVATMLFLRLLKTPAATDEDV